MMTDITRILNAIENGNERAVNQLILTLYQELRHLAANKLQGEGIIGLLPKTAKIFYCNMEIKEFEKQLPLDTFIATQLNDQKGLRQ